MATIRKTITLTDQQADWIRAQIELGRFTNDSEYIRDLVRRDQEDRAKLEALRKAIQDGLDSGVSERGLEDIWEAAEQRFAPKDE